VTCSQPATNRPAPGGDKGLQPLVFPRQSRLCGRGASTGTRGCNPLSFGGSCAPGVAGRTDIEAMKTGAE